MCGKNRAWLILALVTMVATVAHGDTFRIEIDEGFLVAGLNGRSNEHWCGPDLINGTHSILSDYDEWGAIMDMTTISPPEPCVSAEMRFVRADGSVGASGGCSDAYDSVSGAMTGAPDGSVFILEPLVWSAGGQVCRNKAIFISAQSAVLR